MGDCCPRRPSCPSVSGCSSFSSESSEEERCPRRKRKMNYLAKCGPLKGAVNKLMCRYQRAFMCMDPRNWTGLAVVLFSTIAFAFLGYFVGLPLLKLILPESWMKSTATLIREALAKYNADRIGRADYALESAGGSILCSSTTYYSKSGALYSLFGVPLWYHASTPRMVIQPEVQPGTCWAMDGTQGYVTIQLAMPVIITAVSVEHIPREVSPLGRLDSAPKEFLIMGKEINSDSPEVMLGKFTYSMDGEPIQLYDIKEPFCAAQIPTPKSCGPNTRPYSVVTLKVRSNHGNPDYTCLYRLRVHGRPYFTPGYE